MNLTRGQDAAEYQAPGHHGMTAVRLQGYEASQTTSLWAGLSRFAPQGGAVLSASPSERIYLVLSGQMTVVVDGERAVLGPMDSLAIRPGETRELRNDSDSEVQMLVIGHYPAALKLSLREIPPDRIANPVGWDYSSCETATN